MKQSTWRTIGGVLSFFFLLDTLSYLITGEGLAGVISGSDNPVVLAVIQHIAPVPGWMFGTICIVAVFVCAALLYACVHTSRKGYL